MSARLKALKTLVKVRERQAEGLRRAHDAARQQLADARAALQEAQAGEERAQAAETEARAELDRLTRGPFTPVALRALDFRIEDRKSEAAQAARAKRDREAALGRHEAAVVEAAQAVQANERRIEGFRAQIERLAREREAALEELGEEETEEAATARFVARVRAAAAAQEADHA